MACAPPPSSNDLLECPYNIAHQILRSRFQTHLVKCRKSYPEIKKVPCPFNVTHLVYEPEMNWHVTVCEDRASFVRYKYVVDSGISKIADSPPALHPEVETNEDWTDYEAPTYDPTAYATSAPVLRSATGLKPSERKAFRQAERKRLNSDLMK